jgi:hypothetical protein
VTSLADIATAALHAGLVCGVIGAGPKTGEDAEDGPHGRVGCLLAALVDGGRICQICIWAGLFGLSLGGAAICLVSIFICCLVGLLFSRCAGGWCGGRQGRGGRHGAAAPREQKPNQARGQCCSPHFRHRHQLEIRSYGQYRKLGPERLGHPRRSLPPLRLVQGPRADMGESWGRKMKAWFPAALAGDGSPTKDAA